jgi:hypothetical protein
MAMGCDDDAAANGRICPAHLQMVSGAKGNEEMVRGNEWTWEDVLCVLFVL